MKKPLGIKIIIFIFLFLGIVALVVAGVIINSLSGVDDKTLIAVSLAPFILIMLIYFVAAYGLWTMKKWGPNFSKWLYILGAFISLFTLIKPLLSDNPLDISDILENIIALFISIAVARYLSRKSIKEMYHGAQ